MNNERYELLMVKVADETATPAEREALMSWLAEHPEQRKELEETLFADDQMAIEPDDELNL